MHFNIKLPIILRFLVIGVINFYLVGCGYEKKIGEMRLDVEVLGVFKAPDWAEGNVAPNSVSIGIQEITFTAAADSEHGDFVVAENANLGVRVVDRPQIVFTGDLKNFRDATFTGATVRLSPTVEIDGKYSVENTELHSDEIRLDEEIHFARGKGLRVIIEVHWSKTIDRDDFVPSESFFPPDFELIQRVQ